MDVAWGDEVAVDKYHRYLSSASPPLLTGQLKVAWHIPDSADGIADNSTSCVPLCHNTIGPPQWSSPSWHVVIMLCITTEPPLRMRKYAGHQGVGKLGAFAEQSPDWEQRALVSVGTRLVVCPYAR